MSDSPTTCGSPRPARGRLEGFLHAYHAARPWFLATGALVAVSAVFWGALALAAVGGARRAWRGAQAQRGRDYDRHDRVCTPAEFRAKVNGKTRAEVKALLGDPDTTRHDTWYYWRRVKGPHGKTAGDGTVDFDEEGKAQAHFSFDEK